MKPTQTVYENLPLMLNANLLAETMRLSCNKTDFVTRLREIDIIANWYDERKYIVFSDESVNKVRNKILSKTFKINLDKEKLLYGFRQNYGRAIWPRLTIHYRWKL